MVEIDGVKYEKVNCDKMQCSKCDLLNNSEGIVCALAFAGCKEGPFYLKRIKEEVMFKKGDRVVCVDVCADASFTVGKAYIIDRINSSAAHGGLIFAIDDCGNLQGMYAKRFKPAPQYTTRPIDYTGCDPVIAEHLQRGESILCECRDDVTNGQESYIVAYHRSTLYPYIGTSNTWSFAKPIPRKRTETRVKKASEIVAWLEDNGYTYNDDNNWAKSFEESFTPSMFSYCGKVKTSRFQWHDEWLEEIAVLYS